MFKKTKTWIIIFALLFILSIALYALLSEYKPRGSIAVIRKNGEVYDRIDLSAVTKPYEIRIGNEHGYNIVLVSPGSVAVVSADCPDHICIKRGEIKTPGLPIVCLPHKLTVEIEGEP